MLDVIDFRLQIVIAVTDTTAMEISIMPRNALECEGRKGLPQQFTAKLETMLDLQRICSETVNSDGSLKPEGWRALLQASNLDLAVFVPYLGVSSSFISQVISRRKRSRKVEDTLAEFFHLDADRVWGRK